MLNFAQQLDDARRQTDALFRVVKDSHLYDRPVAERHRLIFYLGHLEAFDWNQIGRWALQQDSFHAEFDQLFEAGIDPDIGQGPTDQPSDWPTRVEVALYARNCRERIDSLLPQVPNHVI